MAIADGTPAAIVECVDRALELARYVEAGRVTDPSDHIAWPYVATTLVCNLSTVSDDLHALFDNDHDGEDG